MQIVSCQRFYLIKINLKQFLLNHSETFFVMALGNFGDVLTKEEVADANARIDTIPRSLPRKGWHGWVQREDHPEHRGHLQVLKLPRLEELRVIRIDAERLEADAPPNLASAIRCWLLQNS